MKTTLFLGAALLSAALLIPTGRAESTSASSTAPAEARSDSAKSDTIAKKSNRPVPFRGKVAAVDSQQMTITLSGPKQRVFVLTTDSKVEKDGKPAVFADIALGDEARGLYQNEDGGKLVVVKASFGPKPDKATKEAKTSAQAAKEEAGS
ncbi:MAG TPA: hypothetical protein PLX89_22690 [Verrucomicrobiota bacterium]|nr:hypothetical protein [Verrucomicrobiales bacterium]HRI15815.1 hypothetical protein [Verrucomicrobiota bacterium]